MNTRMTSFVRGLGDSIDFQSVEHLGYDFADYLERHHGQVVAILTRYETHEVANDELERTLDLFRSLKENGHCFEQRIDRATCFLPRNQPLYALSCFGIVPSLMAREAFVRPPVVMSFFFLALCKALSLEAFFPNLVISLEPRDDFVNRIARFTENASYTSGYPKDAVIFTGTMQNADKLRKRLNPSVLFIANGSGHNPVVVTGSADVSKAVHGVMRVQLYNQGQDCASPSSILVDKSVYPEFLELLNEKLLGVRVGLYSDPEVRVGPISDSGDLLRISKVLQENATWLHPHTEGVIHTRSAIVEPTVIAKPLRAGGNYIEQFAPIFFVQEYEGDTELALYFENHLYPHNAMYVTLYGKSPYVDSLVWQDGDVRMLHSSETIVRDTDLHAPGVERGVKPYGGYGRGASCYSIGGLICAEPTLPQREIFEQLVLSGRDKLALSDRPRRIMRTAKVSGDVKPVVIRSQELRRNNVPLQSVEDKKGEPVLLRERNLPYISLMSELDMRNVMLLKEGLCKSESVSDLQDLLYEIPKNPESSKSQNRESQVRFFSVLYNLLRGSKQGPRLATLLTGSDKAQILQLLDVRSM